MKNILRRGLYGLVGLIIASGAAFGASPLVYSFGLNWTPTGPALFSGSDMQVTTNAVNVLRNQADGTTTQGGISVTSLTDTGAATIATTLGVTGVTTPTGGVAAAAGGSASPRLIATCGYPAIISTSGTDSTPSVTEMYVAEVFVPANMTVTGVAYFGGSATGSGNIQASMYTAAGAPVTAAQTASTAISATDAYQLVPFAAPWAAIGPATYYIAEQFNNTSTRFNTHHVGVCGAGKITSTTFGTFAAITSPTTFTADLGPMASLY